MTAPLPLDRWHRRDALFDEALDLPSAERAAFLRDACGDDEPLCAELTRLLAIVDGTFLEQTAMQLAPELLDALPVGDGLAAGTRVGDWRIAGPIGEGGLGVVFLGQPARGRAVPQAAIKVARLGFDAAVMRRRFEHECLLLQRFNHPSVVRALGSGTTPDGRPYLAMEYVAGEAITAYSARHRLSPEARRGLAAQACEAVAHVHACGVVHGDLTPANLLVSGPPSAPVVHVLDFGSARGCEEAQTLQAPLPHTPAYAAPEQLSGGRITMATDVYTLGLVLQELLAGTSSNADGPAPPFAVLNGTMGQKRVSPTSFAALPRELQAVCGRATALDPAQRYAGARPLCEALDAVQVAPVA